MTTVQLKSTTKRQCPSQRLSTLSLKPHTNKVIGTWIQSWVFAMAKSIFCQDSGKNW